MEELKTCRECSKKRANSSYYPSGKGTFDSVCKYCRLEKKRLDRQAKRAEKEKYKPKPLDDNRPDHECFQCRAIKPAWDFYRNKTDRGHDGTCKECRKAEMAKREENKKNGIILPRKKPRKPTQIARILTEATSQNSKPPISQFHQNMRQFKQGDPQQVAMVARMMKVGDDRRYQKGYKRLQKSGEIRKAILTRPIIIFKNNAWTVRAEIRADGVLFNHESDYFQDRESAVNHLEYLRENAKTIVKEKL